MSVTRVKNFNIDNSTSDIEKTHFHSPILGIWQMKDCKEGKSFILKMPRS